jgi:ubiquitin thioesterase protein OTUB1
VGDVNKFAVEEVRLNSMGNLLDHAGYHREIWIDFAEEAFSLLRALGDSLQLMDGAAEGILLTTFNDPSTSMAIITFFKVSFMHSCPR